MSIFKDTQHSPSQSRLLYFVSFFIWCILFFYGSLGYQGSSYVYTIFSLSYLALIFSAFYIKVTYGYMFLSVILWLGFWLKTTIHIIMKYSFIEPTGSFKFSDPEWDSVLLVATTGALGVISARVIYHLVAGKESTLITKSISLYSSYYDRYKLWIWLAFASAIIISASVNSIYSFQQIGLVPKTIIWPINTLLFWMLSTGFSMILATLLRWEIASSSTKNNVAYFILIEAAAASVSLLSRGMYVFHTIPILLSIKLNFQHIKNWNHKKTFIFLCSFFLVFVLFYPLVNSIRDHHYSSIPFALPWNFYDGSIIEKGFIKLAMFSVDRWVGIEGLMATSSYPNKNMPLLLSTILEKAEIGKASIFQEIALSHYRHMDLTKYSFASLPGPISFFYSSGSKSLVFIGMCFICCLVLASEFFVYKLLSNPILSALWGSIVATSTAQMGINIRGLMLYFSLCLAGILTLYIIQRYFFTSAPNNPIKTL